MQCTEWFAECHLYYLQHIRLRSLISAKEQGGICVGWLPRDNIPFMNSRPLPRRGLLRSYDRVECLALPEAHLSYQAGFLTHSLNARSSFSRRFGYAMEYGACSLYTVAGPLRHLTWFPLQKSPFRKISCTWYGNIQITQVKYSISLEYRQPENTCFSIQLYFPQLCFKMSF